MPSRRIKRATVVGVFRSRNQAERAIEELRRAGFMDDQIGMVIRDASGKPVQATNSDNSYLDEGAVTGIVAGAGAGAIIGLGVLAGVIPVIGPVLAVGALGTVLLNAAGGAALAGLAGALIGWGIPAEEAEYYEAEVKAGRFLVTVAADGRAAEARAILDRFGGFDRSGWLTAALAPRGTAATGTAATGTAGMASTPRRGRSRQEPPIILTAERAELVVDRHPVKTPPATGETSCEPPPDRPAP
jgi:hypothetical protein